ncbi:MAG: hypothetical protein JW750_09315 [Anaerolineaceae bacterium]|nr:hypothetical protein [Anaerolineaceae bacterium]
MKKRTRLLLFLLCLMVILTGCQKNPAGDLVKSSAADYGYPWWNDAVFYQVFVRSFYDSDGDGIGDFNGLTEKLDYLNDGDPETDTDLEVTGIWLMPIFPSPSYHGYDVMDYTAVNPDYGTMEDFERFVEAAHQRGIRVILDWEVNHTSKNHPWFTAAEDLTSEYHDWYIWRDEKPDWSGPWGQEVWHYSLKTRQFYYGIFWDGMPDLNFENAEVGEAMYAAVDFWLSDVGVDGLRIDGARHLIEEGQKQENTPATHDWYKQFYAWYKQINPDWMTVGEVWDISSRASQFVDGEEMDLVFDFDLAGEWLEAVNYNYGPKVGKAIEKELGYFPEFQMGTFLTNHDMNRTMSVLKDDPGKAKTAGSILLTSPGVPFIYYGEEIGMMGSKPDENIRRPMQWSADSFAGFTNGSVPWKLPYEDFGEKNVALQDADEESILNHYRRLVNLRNQYPALKIGSYAWVDGGSTGVYAALRATEEETILVVINMSGEAISDYALTLAASGLSGSFKGFDLLGNGKAASLTLDENGGFAAYQPVGELAPYTTYLFWME